MKPMENPETKSGRNLSLIWLYAFMTDCLFFVPVLLPFYKDNIGIGYRELMLGEAALAASCLAFDIPTGWISDVWQRKYVLVLGAMVEAAGVAVYLFAHSLTAILIAQIIAGAGLSLINGNHAAILYDTLVNLRREDEYRRLEGRRQALTLYAGAFAGIAGGLLYAHDHLLPFYLAIAAQLLAASLATLLQEPARQARPDGRHPFRDIAASLRFVLRDKPRLAFVMLAAAFLLSTARVIMWLQQPYYMALHIPTAAFGVLIAAGSLLGGAASQLAHRYQQHRSSLQIVAACGVAMVVLCAAAGLWLSYGGVALLMLGGSCAVGAVFPAINTAINRNTAADRRGTILSAQSFLNYALFIPAGGLVGWLSDARGATTALLAIAAILALGGAVLLVGRKAVRRAEAAAPGA